MLYYTKHNIAYVAVTRAKKHITFVGGIPEIYGGAGPTITRDKDYEAELKDAAI